MYIYNEPLYLDIFDVDLVESRKCLISLFNISGCLCTDGIIPIPIALLIAFAIFL